MYQSIWELPTIVLNSLNEEDATKWMTAYNECNPRNNDEARNAKRKAWHSVAKAPSSFSFEIIASTDTIDRAKDIIDLDSTKKHMDSFIDYGGNIQNDHHNYTVGTIWDWKPCKVKDDKNREVDGIIAYGNLFGGDLVYDNIRKSFVNGMNKLSIAGEAAPGKYQCDERGCYTRRNVQQLLEISLCVEPMNKYCTLVDYNKDATIKKSASAFNLRIQEYTLHKDTAACPIMSLKKSLTAIGYDAHAREDGVHIPMTFMEFLDDEDNFRAHGLNIDYNGRLGEAVVTRGFTRANKAEKMFGQAATDVMKENQQAKIQEQMDIPGMDDDEPYEWITSGILGEWQRGGKIEPDKITNPDLSRNMRSGKPSFFYVNQLGMPQNTVYASRRNSHGGSHWLESWKMMDGLDLSDKDVGQFANGISFDLNPNARHLVVNNKQEWQDLLKKYPLLVKNPEDPDGEFTIDKDKSVLPNWDAIAKDYDSMYMSPQLIMYLKAIRNKNHAGPEINLSREIRRQPLNVDGEDALIANMDVEGPDHMFIFNPNAILRQKPYRYNESAKPTKMDYKEKNRKYPSYSQQAFKNQAQGKIQSEARVIPKEWMQ